MQCDSRLATAIARELHLVPLIAKMLVARGITDPEAARIFLNPRLEDLHDPFLLKDMDRVVKRLDDARQLGQRVLIYGDYDVDGITSTVVLKRALEMLGFVVDFHLPRRLEDGYGLQAEAVHEAAERGFEVVITADCGIRAFEVCEVAHQLGLDLIVTDHHLPAQRLPEAFAILNPRQPGCPYPNKDLAAVGVIFKLVEGLFLRAEKHHLAKHFLKLVSIGTIADLVPLQGENRLIAKFGLAALSDPRNIGLKALLKGAGVEHEVNHSDVGFKLAPRINAVTRMGGGREVVDLFSTRDVAAAESLVTEMNSKNLQRREEEAKILAEIETRYQQRPEAFSEKFLVVAGRDWHRGVIGIVASRLVDRFYRPTLVVSVSDSICQGSGRSIPGFHLLEALDSCSGLFSRYGGHAEAVGCSFDPQGCRNGLIDRLRTALCSYADSTLEASQLVPQLRIESVLPTSELNLALFDQIQQLAPFGVGNPVPFFASCRARVAAGPWVLKERHLKLRLETGEGESVEAIWWGKGQQAEQLKPGDQIDVTYTLSKNVYGGQARLQLFLRDLRREPVLLDDRLT